MKKFWNKIKPMLIITFWVLCVSGMMVLTGAAISHQQRLSFQSINVNIDESNGILFLSKDDVTRLLKDDQVNIDQSKPISEVNYGKLERVIENNPYVENAELFVDANGTIQINIQQRTPILRVINNQGVGYYLDEHASKMPLSSKFTARVPVATGNILAGAENSNKNDSVTQQKLYVLAAFISSDTFLTSLIEQVVVNNQKEFELIPRIGNHTILLGDVNELQEKFSKLKIFYRDGLNHVGWNGYSQVNLKYKNEVYCKKRTVDKTILKPVVTAVADTAAAVAHVKP
ncbi:MAG TPA: hypothetical protein PLD84_02410 [Chitinophagales bacterium]|nr:hypothetical protein [Chitinophagales bacterium]